MGRSQPKPPPERDAARVEAIMLRGGAEVEVVGETHYQDALSASTARAEFFFSECPHVPETRGCRMP
ncbi:MAG: hypothetical protein U5R31_14850 [Acidimicrobiia bacterium]|nr:hypothetical protein [Acidimicrobiia bacterium]